MLFSAIRRFAACLCALALLTIASCKSAPKAEKAISASQPLGGAPPAKPLNVIFITLDTVRADHLHCYGNNKIETPVIDGLAARGVLFEKAVTQAPLTLPSHASMFTGTNPNVNHVRDTGGFALQRSSITLANILQKSGWDTGAFVSAVVFKRVFGFDQGFSVYDDRMKLNANGTEAERRSAGATVDQALGWLNTQSGKPVFVWLHFYDAHSPYDPPPAQFRTKYPGNTYDAEIAYMDQQLGRFLDAVKKKYPADKTMVVLLSDHGEDLGQYGEYHHGIFLYDATVRIAWIMAGPGIPAGLRVQQQARTIDVLPTILDLLGGKSSSAVQGTSLVPTFSGHQVPSTYSYEETLYGKIIMHWAALRGIHTADWMYIRAPKPELYDLDKDPGELHNVIRENPKKYRELEEQLKLQSHLGENGSEKIVSAAMDEQTMARLRSLGYAGGASAQTTVLDDSGADPKDRLDVMRLIHLAKDPPPGAVSPSQKIDLYRKALEQDPTNPSIYYELADQYIQTGQYDLAIQTCLGALNHGVKDSTILSRLGHLYLTTGDAKQAIQYYQQAEQLDPLDAGTQAGLATAYSNNGQYAQAEREFQRVLAIQQYVPAYSGLGLLQVREHNFVAARASFEHAIELDPHFAEAELNLGVLCMQTGDAPCARKSFNAFLANASPTEYKDTIPKVHNALNTVLAHRQ